MGTKLINTLGLSPLTTGFTSSYKDTINPSIVNAFAAAAGRQHTLIPSLIRFSIWNKQKVYIDLSHFCDSPKQFISSFCRVTETASGRVLGAFELKSSFGNMDTLRSQGMIGMLMKGLLEHPAEMGDENYVNDVRVI